MDLALRLQGINEYYFSQKLREIDGLNRAGKDIINLGIGSPDMPPHPEVIKILQEESAKPGNHAYQGYKGSATLRQAIATWYSRYYAVELNPETQILPLIGSKEGIMHICMTYLNIGDQALIPNPGYPTYSAAVRLAGGEPLSYDLTAAQNWLPDFEALEHTDLQKVKLMFVNYPHMPTGALPDSAVFGKLVSFAQKHSILLVHDNPYSFILNDQPRSIMSTAGAMEVAIELNSLSKSHNMAGWRVGMLVGASDRINEILKFKSNMDSGMFLPLQLAAARALELDELWHSSVNDAYKKRQTKVFQLLEMLDCKFEATQAGMFVWASVPEKYADGYGLSDELLASAGVFITPGGIFGSNGNIYVRVSLCASEEKVEQAIVRIKNR